MTDQSSIIFVEMQKCSINNKIEFTMPGFQLKNQAGKKRKKRKPITRRKICH